MVIMKNAVKCKVYGSYIRINTEYDYIPCACGAIAVDGGPEYVRIIGDPNNWEIVTVPVPKEN